MTGSIHRLVTRPIPRPLARATAAGVLLMLGACAQFPPPVVADAAAPSVAVAEIRPVPESDVVVATPLPEARPLVLPRPVYVPRPIYFPAPVYVPTPVYVPRPVVVPTPVYQPDPVVVPTPGNGHWIPVVN